MGKILRITALLVLLPAVLSAGGETGADILKEKTGIRAAAIAGAYTAVADDVESINYNPAGLASIVKKEAELYGFWGYADMAVFHAAFAQPFELALLEGFAGLSLIYRGMPDIDNEDAADDPVAYYDVALTASYASALYQFIKDDLFKSVKVGLSLKLVLEQIGLHGGATIAADFGIIYTPDIPGLKFGLSLMNAGLPLQVVRGDAGDPLTSSPLPMTLRGGASYRLVIDANNSTLFSLDYAHDFYDSGLAAIGIEHNLINILFLRLGFNMPADTRNPSALAAGAGINITTAVPVELTVSFNYAYRLVMWNWFNAPDGTHAVSIGVKF